MIIELDLTTVPPRTTLLDPDDFTGFKVLTRGTHAFVAHETLLSLAGARADDPVWAEKLADMIAYADSKGWTDASGAIRAHVEHDAD